MKTCTLEDKMIELKVNETETDSFKIGSKTASKLEISEDDILLAKNPSGNKKIAGEAKIDESVEEKTVLISRALFESVGLEEGTEIGISSYEKKVKSPVEVQFKVKDSEERERDPLKVVKENEEEFLDFLNNWVWTKDSKFLWEDGELIISVDETDLEIGKSDVFNFTRLEDFSFDSVDSHLKSYSGVLLIDLSGSMETRDLSMEGIDTLVENIHAIVKDNRTNEFLQNLKDKSKIKRSQGVALSALTYLIQEIEKGLGDKLSVILFSDEASVIEFNDQRYFSTEVCDIDSASEDIIEEIIYHPRGRTNISAGLEKAIETMKDFDHEEMKMLVLLTDGKPYPSAVDEKDTVEKLIENRFAPRMDVTINTIGLGDEVDHHLLDKIANKTGGEYTYVRSLNQLIEAYSRYADSISSYYA